MNPIAMFISGPVLLPAVGLGDLGRVRHGPWRGGISSFNGFEGLNFVGRDFDDVESDMSSDWAASRGASRLSWERAKHAARDAWNRINASS